MSEQLPLDFSASASERMRRARKRAEKAEEKPLTLFASPPNIDVHLHSPQEAVASFAGEGTGAPRAVARRWANKSRSDTCGVVFHSARRAPSACAARCSFGATTPAKLPS